MCRVPWTSCAEPVMAQCHCFRDPFGTKSSLASVNIANALLTELWSRKYGISLACSRMLKTGQSISFSLVMFSLSEAPSGQERSTRTLRDKQMLRPTTEHEPLEAGLVPIKCVFSCPRPFQYRRGIEGGPNTKDHQYALYPLARSVTKLGKPGSAARFKPVCAGPGRDKHAWARSGPAGAMARSTRPMEAARAD